MAGGIWWSRRGANVPPPPQGNTEVRPEPEKKPDPQPPTVVDPAPRKLDRLVGHTDTVTGLVFPAGGQTLASASADGTVRLWALTDGPGKTLTTHPAPCTALAADGRTLASGSRDGFVRLDDLDTGKVLETFTVPDRVWGLAFGRNRALYLATDHGVVIRWLGTNRSEPDFFAAHQAARMVAVDPRGDMVIAGTHQRFLFFRFLKQPAGQQIADAHQGPVRVGVFSPDGDVLATAGGPPDDRVRLWDLNVIRGMKEFPRAQNLAMHPGGATAVAWSPDGRVIASGGIDGVVKLWDPKTGDVLDKLPQHTPGPTGGVTCLAF